MVDEFVGGRDRQPGFLPVAQRLTADAQPLRELRHQLEAVVVGRRPPQELDGQHQQVVDLRGRRVRLVERRMRRRPRRASRSLTWSQATRCPAAAHQLSCRDCQRTVSCTSSSPRGSCARQRHRRPTCVGRPRHAQPAVSDDLAVDEQLPRGGEIIEAENDWRLVTSNERVTCATSATR